MKLFIKAKPRSKHPGVTKVSDNSYIVAVREVPEDGKANQAIIKALAGHLGVALSSVRIVAGHTGRHKMVEVQV